MVRRLRVLFLGVLATTLATVPSPTPAWADLDITLPDHGYVDITCPGAESNRRIQLAVVGRVTRGKVFECRRRGRKTGGDKRISFVTSDTPPVTGLIDGRLTVRCPVHQGLSSPDGDRRDCD